MTIQDTLPQDFVMRHPTMDDAEVALEVIKAHQMAVCGESEQRIEDVRGWWSSDELPFPEDVWLVENSAHNLYSGPKASLFVRLYKGRKIPAKKLSWRDMSYVMCKALPFVAWNSLI